jgi:hypothetical protein
VLKDEALLDVRVREGRFTQDQADGFRAEADRITAELDAGGLGGSGGLGHARAPEKVE